MTTLAELAIQKAGPLCEADKEILLISPTEIEIQYFLTTTHSITVVTHCPEMFEQARRYSGNLTVVSFDPVGFLQSLPLQVYNVIYANGSNIKQQKWCRLIPHMARRVLRFGGRFIMPSTHTHVDAMASSFFAGMCHVDMLVGGGESLLWYTKAPGWLLMGHPRCGSHMLQTALDRHPNLTCRGEVFNKNDVDGHHGIHDFSGIFEACWRGHLDGMVAHGYQRYAVGVVAKLVPPSGYDELWSKRLWATMPDSVKIVATRRRNLLARYVSHLRAKQTKQWSRDKGEAPKNIKVVVHPNSFLQDVAYTRACWRLRDRQFPDMHIVWYEDMVNEWGTVIDGVCKYLDVSPGFETQPACGKIGRRPQDDIDNYDVLVRHFRDNPEVSAWLKEE